MKAQISDVKENLEPASVFVLGLMVYLIIVIVWNNSMRACPRWSASSSTASSCSCPSS
jgi:hypothetical protein